MTITIYHNPDCGTSRNTLAMIRNAGVEPHVIEYLKTPPSRPLRTETGPDLNFGKQEPIRDSISAWIGSIFVFILMATRILGVQ